MPPFAPSSPSSAGGPPVYFAEPEPDVREFGRGGVSGRVKSSPSSCLCLRGVDALGAGGLVHRERIVAECPPVRLFAHFGSQPWPYRGGPGGLPRRRL